MSQALIVEQQTPQGSVIDLPIVDIAALRYRQWGLKRSKRYYSGGRYDDCYRDRPVVPEYFDIEHHKGILTFFPRENHLAKGVAEFNITTGRLTVNGQTINNKTYFMGYRFSAPRLRWGRGGCGSYDHRTNITDDFKRIRDSKFRAFFFGTVLPKFSSLTQSNARSVSALLDSIPRFENIWNWYQIGVKCQTLIEFNPSHVNPAINRLLTRERFIFNALRHRDCINTSQIKIFEEIIMSLDLERIPNREIEHQEKRTWESFVYDIDRIERLVQNRYQIRDIIQYLFNYITIYENMKIADALMYLDDYANMQTLMGVTEFKKYPKFLKSNHDIVAQEYNRHKKTIDEEVFKKKINLGLQHATEKYCVLAPACSEDLKNEGKALSHCVGSYVDRIISGETQIVFLRKEPTVSMVTLEIRDRVLIQAKGHANRSILKEERDFIKDYCKAKSLLMRI